MSSTISTSHAPADHHHLRHTGPSISTRARASTAPSKPPPAPAHPEPTPEILPQKAPHEKKLLAEVPPPGARTSWAKFIYVLLFIVLLLLVWYVYGMVTLLARLKDEVGWWGIVVGDTGQETWKGWRTSESRRQGAQKGELEGSLNALADALGIPPVQVASAVRPVVPRESLASIASKADETGRPEAVRILFEDTTRNDREGAWKMARA